MVRIIITEPGLEYLASRVSKVEEAYVQEDESLVLVVEGRKAKIRPGDGEGLIFDVYKVFLITGFVDISLRGFVLEWIMDYIKDKLPLNPDGITIDGTEIRLDRPDGSWKVEGKKIIVDLDI